MARTQIPGSMFAAGSIPAAKLGNGVTNTQLAGSISQDKLTGGITNAQLAGSISQDKLAGSIPVGKVDLSGTWNFSGTLQEGGQDVARLTEIPAYNSWKDTAKVVTANVANLSSPGAIRTGGGRVLLTAQTTASQNGLYDWVDNTTALVRTADANTDAEVGLGMTVTDEDTRKIYVLTGKSGNLGTGNLTFDVYDQGLTIAHTRTAGDGSAQNFDLGHSSTIVITVSVGGIVQRAGASHDYQLNAGAGGSGVDRIDFTYVPDNGANIVVTYARRV